MRKPFVITTPGRSVEETARVMGVSRKRLKELVELVRESMPEERTVLRRKNSEKGVESKKRT